VTNVTSRADATRPAAPPTHDPLMPWYGVLVAAIVVILDQATKELAESMLVRGQSVDVIASGWGWQLVYNDGGAFGMPAPSWFFLVVTVVVAWIVVRSLPRAPDMVHTVAYGLLMAGALGNALDRIFRVGDPGDPRFFHGHVVDFVAWGSFPRFNIADVAITCGFVLLIAVMYRDERRELAGRGAEG
jgi:signal peptidase II